MRDQKDLSDLYLAEKYDRNRLVKSKFTSGPGNLAKIKPEKLETRRLDQFLAVFRSKNSQKLIQTANFRLFRLDFRKVPRSGCKF